MSTLMGRLKNSKKILRGHLKTMQTNKLRRKRVKGELFSSKIKMRGEINYLIMRRNQ
jgi:hypothetical protein